MIANGVPGTGDEDADGELRRYAVEAYIDMLEKPLLNDTLLQVIAWVLGEYSYVCEDITPDEVFNKLVGALNRPGLSTAWINNMILIVAGPTTMGCLITALEKLVAQQNFCPPAVNHVVNKYAKSRFVELQQRCCEFAQLIQNFSTMEQVLPVDASCEDIQVEEDLPFLDEFVDNAVQFEGAKPWIPPSQRHSWYTASALGRHQGLL